MAGITPFRRVRLIAARDPGRPTVVAELHRGYPATHLDIAESSWAQAREAATAGRATDLEHSHWNWCNKGESVNSGIHLLVGVEYHGEPQGLMAIRQSPRTACLGNGRILYIDYVETAPWNLKGSHVTPQFLGVGTLLIADAIRMSVEMGLAGAIGLHSLPQAEAFHERIGMKRLGSDPDYHDLAYFEYDGQEAMKWLTAIGEAI